ncbi:MAG TPA: PHP domain-containing protein, partial [Streptosporangiaceae bacterium]
MGWENPPVPWREFERRLSWRSQPRPVTRLPTGPGRRRGPDGAGLDGAGPDGADRDGSDRDGSGPSGPYSEEPDPGGPQWAELHCHSSYSFLDGASSPAELVAEAARLGLAALAITDHDGMYGTAQFAQAAARLRAGTGTRAGTGPRTVFGAELSLGLATRSSPGPRGRSRRSTPPGIPDPPGE